MVWGWFGQGSTGEDLNREVKSRVGKKQRQNVLNFGSSPNPGEVVGLLVVYSLTNAHSADVARPDL